MLADLLNRLLDDAFHDRAGGLHHHRLGAGAESERRDRLRGHRGGLSHERGELADRSDLHRLDDVGSDVDRLGENPYAFAQILHMLL